MDICSWESEFHYNIRFLCLVSWPYILKALQRRPCEEENILDLLMQIGPQIKGAFHHEKESTSPLPFPTQRSDLKAEEAPEQ